jgi:hypothetical protein
MKTYVFEAVCNSGTKKTFTCTAKDFADARVKLAEFVATN